MRPRGECETLVEQTPTVANGYSNIARRPASLQPCAVLHGGRSIKQIAFEYLIRRSLIFEIQLEMKILFAAGEVDVVKI